MEDIKEYILENVILKKIQITKNIEEIMIALPLIELNHNKGYGRHYEAMFTLNSIALMFEEIEHTIKVFNKQIQPKLKFMKGKS